MCRKKLNGKGEKYEREKALLNFVQITVEVVIEREENRWRRMVSAIILVTARDAAKTAMTTTTAVILVSLSFTCTQHLKHTFHFAPCNKPVVNKM